MRRKALKGFVSVKKLFDQNLLTLNVSTIKLTLFFTSRSDSVFNELTRAT